MQILEGIKQKNFLVIGRVGMDMCPEPAGLAPGRRVKPLNVP